MSFKRGLARNEMPAGVKLKEDYDILSKCKIGGTNLDLDDYSMPPTGPDAEKDSFATHMRVACDYKDYINDPTIPAKIDSILKFAKSVGGYFHPSDFVFSWSNVAIKLNGLMTGVSMKSSPGVPYAYVYKDNQAFIDADRVAVFNMVIARLFDRLRIYERMSKGENFTPEQLIAENVCDPVRVFIKREPHKRSKVRERRWRTIWSVSLIDSLCDRLFYWPDKIHINNWCNVPMKPGTPLGTSFGDQELCESMFGPGVVLESHDKKHFDLLIRWARWKAVACVRAAWAVSDEEVRALYEDPFSSKNIYVQQVVMSMYLQMFKVVVFSDGVAAVTEGFYEPSGSAGTASNNSLDNALCHFDYAYSIGADPLPCAVYGDDFVATFLAGESDYLEKLGILVKPDSVMRSKDSFEFCSRLYNRTPEGFTSKFLGVRKTLYNWLCNTPSDERNYAVVKELGPIGEKLLKILPTLKGIG